MGVSRDFALDIPHYIGYHIVGNTLNLQDELSTENVYCKEHKIEKEQIVSQDPNVMPGTLVFAGTRVPVESLIQHIVAGESLGLFLEDFPTVSREQVVAYLHKTLEFAHARVA